MTRKLKITFVLPGAGNCPVGGYKVVYEYANRLSLRGHQVTVVHPAFGQKNSGSLEFARSMLRYLFRKTIAGYKPQKWFQVDPTVRLLWVPFPSARCIPDGDSVIATAWQTAEWVAAYPPSKGGKAYLIQQFENWHGMDERVTATWKLPLRKFVISQWLLDFARSLGEDAHYQPNGLDFQKFVLSKAPESRSACTVMMLYHSAEDKGSADGLKALSIVHEQVPEIHATLFGTPRKPEDLPSWIQYYRLPSQKLLCELYNSCSIFIGPSWTEGWGLPPCEALMCGAALAVTNINGHRTFAIHEETALLSPPKAPELLAANILRLIRDDSLRLKIALAGHEFIQQFTWDRSVELLEAALLQDQVPLSAIEGNDR